LQAHRARVERAVFLPRLVRHDDFLADVVPLWLECQARRPTRAAHARLAKGRGFYRPWLVLRYSHYVAGHRLFAPFGGRAPGKILWTVHLAGSYRQKRAAAVTHQRRTPVFGVYAHGPDWPARAGRH